MLIKSALIVMVKLDHTGNLHINIRIEILQNINNKAFEKNKKSICIRNVEMRTIRKI